MNNQEFPLPGLAFKRSKSLPNLSSYLKAKLFLLPLAFDQPKTAQINSLRPSPFKTAHFPPKYES